MGEYDGLIERAAIKAGMLRMGEKIAFGSDADMIDELSSALTDLQTRLAAAEKEMAERLDSSKRFATAHADLRTKELQASLAAMEKERDEAKEESAENFVMRRQAFDNALMWQRRAEAAESALADEREWSSKLAEQIRALEHIPDAAERRRAMLMLHDYDARAISSMRDEK